MKTKQYKFNDETVDITFLETKEGGVGFELDGEKYAARLIAQDGPRLVIELNGKLFHLSMENNYCRINGKQVHVTRKKVQRSGKKTDDTGGLVSPMPGKILKISAKEGDKVSKGTTLVVMEAMKMEHSLKAPCDCVVDKFFYQEGQLVEGDVELVAITPEEGS